VNGKTKTMVFVVNNCVSKTYVSKKRVFVKIHSAVSAIGQGTPSLSFGLSSFGLV
jgi:hypothetical protein